MKNKDIIRKINYLVYNSRCSHLGRWDSDKFFNPEYLKTFTDDKFHGRLNFNCHELYDLFKLSGMTHNEFREMVEGISLTKNENKNSLKGSPPKESRDNKTVRVGNGRNKNPNTIRFPKKCRKTAWKRFYKLFPNLENEKNIS
jgi:hypothetical protein